MTIREKPATTPRVIDDAAALRELVAAQRGAGKLIGLVPTMGALHEGHLSLVDAARRDCGFVVVTIFVNPTQFGPSEDFTRYPRTLEADLKALTGRGADVVFVPATEAMYPPQHATFVEPVGPALPLEGQFRPGHFRGVTTIVLKLFNLVQPDSAYFGRKDYQQALVIGRMAADLNVPVRIEVCPIVREPDGLAMSSRNIYLSSDERCRALAISQSLRMARELVRQGTRDADAIVGRMRALLERAQLQIEYVVIVDPQTLEKVEQVTAPALAAIAAHVGRTRLIDNEMLGTSDSSTLA